MNAIPGFPIGQRARDLSVVFFASMTPLCALSLATLAYRITTKLRPAYKMGVDDWFIIAGFVRDLSF